MKNNIDTIIIGSGFGGAVTACRLAQSGAKVLVLERGRRWDKSNYPREPGDPWLYRHDSPSKHNGWLDLRSFPGMTVVQGAGVGGGSMCYSSVVMEADPDIFEIGWPEEINYPELAPYYEKVGNMMGVQTIPDNQHTHRYRLMQKGAEALGYKDRFSSVPLAVTFDSDYHYDLPDPLNFKHSKTYTNPQGREQGTCIHLGNCDIGCDVRAKNTLDLNYLAEAENNEAEIRPLHIVSYIEVSGTGYRVYFDRIEQGKLIRDSEIADRVIIAAGSLGSSELLLRCRDQFKSLPNISPCVGSNWSANGNFLTPDIYTDDADVQQGIGPTITAGLDFMDGSYQGQRFFIEDDGFPNMLLNALIAKLRADRIPSLGRLVETLLRRGFDEKNPTQNVMVWLGEGIDAGDGELYLGRSWLKPWKKSLKLAWNKKNSEAVIESILDLHKKLSDVNGGKLRIPTYWSKFRQLVTVHPLGGTKMGGSALDGVVDHRGEVFGYKNLFVADGALLPGPVGRNPSMTIAALAERIAVLAVQE